MSRLGKKPVSIPSGVTVTIQGRKITAQGPKGTLSYEHRPEVIVEHDATAKEVSVTRRNDSKSSKAYHGLTRALVQNLVTGVKDGYSKQLEITGVGWNGRVQGRKLTLNVGYADARVLDIPMGLEVQSDGTKIIISGADKQLVGQFAALARSHRKPEPYNGKGIKYQNEIILRKEGKAFAGK